MFHVVLVNPDIPQNTGNIGRLCVGLGIPLHLVHPLGFVLSDKMIRRTGLDYWEKLQLFEHGSLTEFYQWAGDRRCFYFTTKTTHVYSSVEYRDEDCLIFGSESKGLSQTVLDENPQNTVTLPMPGEVRSLNVSNAAAVASYEVYRQLTSSI